MTYKLTRDDLKTLGNGIRNANSMSVEEHLDAFLADKKTNDWQVIASGGGSKFWIKIFDDYNDDGSDFFKKVQGKQVEIAVRVKE